MVNPLELALFELAQEFKDSDPKLCDRLLELATIAAYHCIYVEDPNDRYESAD